MRRRFRYAFVLLLISTAASAQTTAPGQLPPMGGLGGPVQFGRATQAPAQVQAQAPADGGRPGFGQDAPAPVPAPAPARQNFADELTDFHVAPQGTLKTEVGSETPLSIPGAHVITTDLVRQTQGMQVLLVDVLNAPAHPSIPGAKLWPGAGDGGGFTDTIQTQLWQALSAATNKTRTYPIVFLCAGAKCWESYNAALRASKMGFTQVMWYRGGLASWHAAGLPMTGGGGQQDAPQPPPTGPGFDAP